ncbi:GIY-YIG nuclease family protein [Salmonella enterica]|nr:GIY-YIG nuclease family protein [Salmonella enterica]
MDFQQTEISPHYLYILIPRGAKTFKVGITASPVSRFQSLKEDIDPSISRLFKGDSSAIANMERALHAFLKPWNQRRDVNTAGGGYTEWFDISCQGMVEKYLDLVSGDWGMKFNEVKIEPFLKVAKAKPTKKKEYRSEPCFTTDGLVDIFPAITMRGEFDGCLNHIKGIYLWADKQSVIESAARLLVALFRLHRDGHLSLTQPTELEPKLFADALDFDLVDNVDSLDEFRMLLELSAISRVSIIQGQRQSNLYCWTSEFGWKLPEWIVVQPQNFIGSIEDIDIILLQHLITPSP